ncbi:MAG: hypothetical protein M3474_05580 [Actinomycetota bacterium]|nr:hypothetical protein [Actinomycetota bacterium]
MTAQRISAALMPYEQHTSSTRKGDSSSESVASAASSWSNTGCANCGIS